MYILTDQLETAADTDHAFRAYQEYLDAAADRFPPNALALARSEWYHDFNDHRCPHDAWLQELSVRETGTGPRQAARSAEIVIRLLGAWHDGHIMLRYHDVFSYDCRFERPGDESGIAHADWRYDELRLSARGTLLHEIEWWHLGETARWLIEAADVTFEWIPSSVVPSPGGN